MKVKLSVFVIIVGIVASCQTSNDETAYRTDAAATQTINQANAFLQSRQGLPHELSERLKELHSRYPGSKTVADTYRAALVVRQDWATLADLYRGTPAEKLTIEDKLNLAKALIKLGRYSNAVDELKALGASNNDLEVELLLANAYFHLGTYDNSTALLDRNWAQILSDKKIDEITMRAMIYFYQGDSDKAIELLNRSIELNPDYFPAYNALSRVYSAKGERSKADAYLKEVQRIFDKTTAEEGRKIQLVEKTYRLQEAYQAKRFAEVLELAAQLVNQVSDKDKVTLYQYQYEAYQALGKQKEAEEVLAKARQLQQR